MYALQCNEKNRQIVNKVTMSYHCCELLFGSKCMCLLQIMWQR